MCVVMKREVRRDFPCGRHLADLLSVSIQKRKTHYSFGILVWCLLYSRHVRCTQNEQINNHKVVVEPCMLQEEEDVVVYNVPLSGSCSKFEKY